jgi:hypothetical protein
MSAQPDTSSELARVRALFEQWRERRTFPNQRIPDELWLAAVAVLDHFPLQVVARALHVSDSRLRHKRAALVAPRDAPATPRFVALSIPSLEQEAERTAGTYESARLTIERPDGARLSLALPAQHPALIEALARAFLAHAR